MILPEKKHELPESTVYHGEVGSVQDARLKFINVIDKLNKIRDVDNQIIVTRFVAASVVATLDL